MAGAEARAAWQRTVNRCFMQEDAKRAPKLACCQSSSATTKVDAGPASAADETCHAPTGFTPLGRNPSLYNVSPHTNWWLHLQPEYGYHKGLTSEQLNELENAVDEFSPSYESILSDLNELELQAEVNIACGDSKKDHDFLSLQHGMIAMNEGFDVRKIEAHGKNNDAFVEIMGMERKCKTVETDSITCSFPEKSNGCGSDLESPWLKVSKTEPWWRTSDREELASLVLQKSLDHVENCDLPPPQKYVCRRQCNTNNDKRRNMRYFDWETMSGSSMVSPAYAHGGSNCNTKSGTSLVADDEGHLRCLSDMSSRYTAATQSEVKDTEAASGDNPDKDQLLEALRHSQTRAREAEEAAKKANAEKEDIVKLLFKQASQLFAYKQWFRLLQLENAYLHMKNNDQPISTLIPSFLPWTSYRVRRTRKRGKKNSKAKHGKRVRPKNDMTTYAVAFALGLSLVGAGLLLGWTVGWMLPPL